MKKSYVSPGTTEINIATELVLAASAPKYRPTLDENTNNGQRSEWGNLWK